MSEQKNDTSQLLNHLKGLVKQYTIFDANARIIAVYIAPLHTQPGEPCVRTRYGYRNATTGDVVARKEENSVWDPNLQDWDNESLLEVLPSPAVTA